MVRRVALITFLAVAALVQGEESRRLPTGDPKCTPKSLADEYKKCLTIKLLGGEGKTLKECTDIQKPKVVACGLKVDKVVQVKETGDAARAALVACRIDGKTNCGSTYDTMTGKAGKGETFKHALQAAKGALESVAKDMKKCAAHTKKKDKKKEKECKDALKAKVEVLKGRKISKGEYAAELREAGRKAAGAAISACIGAVADSGRQGKGKKEECSTKNPAARQAYADAAGVALDKIKVEDLREALEYGAITNVKETIQTCVELAESNETSKKACFKRGDLKAFIAQVELLDPREVKDSYVRGYLRKGCQKDILDMTKSTECGKDIALCKGALKEIYAVSVHGKKAIDISDDYVERDLMKAVKDELGENMVACVDEAGTNKTARGECKSIVAEAAIRLGSFMKTVPSKGKIEKMLKDAAKRKAKDFMQNCGGTRDACLQSAKERVGSVLGKVKEEVTTREIELYNMEGAIEGVRDSVDACVQAKKDNSSATCEDLYDTYLMARNMSKPAKKSEYETKRGRVMAHSYAHAHKRVREVCYAKSTKGEADTCLQSFKAEMEDNAKEVFKAYSTKKREAKKKLAKVKAHTNYLGERLSACMQGASKDANGNADKDARNACLKDLDAKKAIAGVVESSKHVLHRHHAHRISEAAAACETKDRKTCMKEARKEFMKYSGLKKRAYNMIKKLGELMVVAEVYAACLEANQTTTECMGLAENEFITLSGLDKAKPHFAKHWDKASKKVVKLATGIMTGADIVMREKKQLLVDVLTDKTVCDASFETKVITKLKSLNKTTTTIMRMATRGCRIVNGLAEYAAAVSTAGLSEEKAEAYADEISERINATDMYRRLAAIAATTDSSLSTMVAQAIEACSSTDTLCGVTDADVMALIAEKLNTAKGVAMKVLGKSGKFVVYSQKAGESDASKVSIELDALREVDSAGKAVGVSTSVKHTIQTFASQDFSIGAIASVKLGSKQTVDAKKLSFRSDVAGVGQIVLDTYIMTSAGKVGPEGEAWDVQPGDLKFNVGFSKWDFCKGSVLKGCKSGEVGEYLEIDIKMKGKNALALLASGKKLMYKLGGGVNLQLTDKVMVDGKQITMPSGYPKLKMKGNGQVFTFRFPKFSTSLMYDPLVGTGASQSFGVTDHAGLSSSPLLFFILGLCGLMLQ